MVDINVSDILHVISLATQEQKDRQGDSPGIQRRRRKLVFNVPCEVQSSPTFPFRYDNCNHIKDICHYGDVMMGTMASQITSLTIVYSIVNQGADQRKHQKLRLTGLCAGSSPVTGEFPAQMASNAENVSIWWRHRVEQKGRQPWYSLETLKACLQRLLWRSKQSHWRPFRFVMITVII